MAKKPLTPEECDTINAAREIIGRLQDLTLISLKSLEIVRDAAIAMPSDVLGERTTAAMISVDAVMDSLGDLVQASLEAALQGRKGG